MTYRERRERRAARLREWADKREQRAEQAHDSARTILDMIPMGQPVLLGHHSEDRHRRDLTRAHSNIAREIEHSTKAAEFRSRAETIEAAAERAIYSDDPDAVERLRERIAELETERDRIKAYNASCRKGSPNPELLDRRQQALLQSIIDHAPYQLGRNNSLPGYALSNLGGNINRQRKRLACLEREAGL